MHGAVCTLHCAVCALCVVVCSVKYEVERSLGVWEAGTRRAHEVPWEESRKSREDLRKERLRRLFGAESVQVQNGIDMFDCELVDGVTV